MARTHAGFRLAPQIAAALILTALAGGCHNDCGHCCKDKNEEAVTMNQLPAPVAATLNRESAGGQVGELEKEMKHGKTVYTAEVQMNGKEYDITIAEDGTLLEKELDDESHEGHESK